MPVQPIRTKLQLQCSRSLITDFSVLDDTKVIEFAASQVGFFVDIWLAS